MNDITKGKHIAWGQLKENFSFVNHWGRSRIAHEHLFLSFLYSVIGSVSTFVIIDVSSSPRVYHLVFHIGDNVLLREDYNDDRLCLYKVYSYVRLLKSLHVATLSHDKVITPFLIVGF